MQRLTVGLATLLVIALAGCGSWVASPAPTGSLPTAADSAGSPTQSPTAPATTPRSTIAAPGPVTMLIDTDVAADDLVALSFALSATNVTVVAITVSGTGEARCPGGVAVVLALLEYLEAPPIPVACGRRTPLARDHAFPDAWRDAADRGSGLELPASTRTAVEGSAVELIKGMAGDHPGLTILTTGPLTNLGDALTAEPGLADRIGPVFIMGGALKVAGNIVGPGAPTGNIVAEWNVYVDPHALAAVLGAGVTLTFVGLDGTNQVPVTREFAQRALQGGSQPASAVLAQLLAANPFMTDGSYYLWDPLAAEVASGFAAGTLEPARVVVDEFEGPESGRTRLVAGDPNARYLATADASAAEDTLLAVLDTP